MIGGIGGEAIYIVGHHEDNFIILDPHYIQEEKNGEGIYFKKTPRRIPIQKISCSVTFCYYVRDREEHEKLLEFIGESCCLCGSDLAVEMDREELKKMCVKYQKEGDKK